MILDYYKNHRDLIDLAVHCKVSRHTCSILTTFLHSAVFGFFYVSVICKLTRKFSNYLDRNVPKLAFIGEKLQWPRSKETIEGYKNVTYATSSLVGVVTGFIQYFKICEG